MKKLLKNISEYFNKEKIDWLDEQPYLGKYFIYKLKRLIMNLIYNLWEGVDKYILEQYFAEINFRNEDKDYDAYMPFIILSRNRNEALNVLGQINSELNIRYNLNVAPITLSDQIVTKELLESIKSKILMDLDKKNWGTVIFDTERGEKIIPEQMKYLSTEIQESVITGNFTKLLKEFEFKIVKGKKAKILLHEKFHVNIQVS